MKTCLVTDSQRLEHFYGKSFFDHTILINRQLIDEILTSTLADNGQVSKVFSQSDLLIVDTEPENSFFVISCALKAGISIISPNLLDFSIDQLKELQIVTQEICADVGFLHPLKPSLIDQETPLIIECLREVENEIAIDQLAHQLAYDLTYLLAPTNQEPRKVKAYWIPHAKHSFKALKLVIDFNDNSVVSYLIRGKRKTNSLRVELISNSNDKLFDFSTDFNATTESCKKIMESVAFFNEKRKMEYSLELTIKSKQMAESVIKKIMS